MSGSLTFGSLSVMSSSSKEKKRILIVDDHTFVRKGLRDFIENEPNLVVCGEAEDCATALALCAKVSPDLVLVDLSLGKDSGLDLIKDIAERFPETKMLVLSMQDEMLYAERVFRAGANGYVCKDAPPAKLIDAFREVFNGGMYASDSVKQKIMKNFRGRSVRYADPVDQLSNRELAVFERIGSGQNTSEIAEIMGLSVKTIETYRARIKMKLGIGHATELVQRATQWAINRNP